MKKALKAILIFGILSIGIDLIKKLIFIKFDLTKLYNLDFVLYDLLLEFGFLIITAFVTHLIVKNFKKDNLGISLTKALLFGIIYAFFSLISSTILFLTLGTDVGIQFDIYESLVKYIPNGFTQGVIFLLVLHHVNPKSRTLTKGVEIA